MSFGQISRNFGKKNGAANGSWGLVCAYTGVLALYAAFPGAPHI